MKKWLGLGLCASAILLTSNACASLVMNNRYIGKTSGGTTESSKDSNKKNQMPESPPACTRQQGAYLWADLLIWSTNYDFLSGVKVDVTNQTVSPIGLTINSTEAAVKITRPEETWTPGTRVGLGWAPGFDNWDIQGFWTFYYNSVHNNHSPISVIAEDEQQVFNQGRAKFRFRYNAGDLELGKSLYLSKNYWVRPFLGAHAVWFSQHDSDRLHASSVTSAITSGALNVAADSSYGFWGIGPRMGLNSNWGSLNGFSLLGNVSGALLYGQTLTKISINIDSVDDTGTENLVDIRVKDGQFWNMVPTLQMLLGVSWGHCFNKSKNQFRISASWEANFLWQAASLLILDKPISMQGLTLDFRFDF